MTEEQQLIEAFKSVWKDRSSLGQLSLSGMKEMIRMELRDELTHPRVRRKPEEKYRIAMVRINNMDISDEVKQRLASYYESELTKILEDVNSN